MATNEFELMRFCREKNDRYHMTKTELKYANVSIHSARKSGGKDFGKNVSFIFNYEFSAFEYILDECINEAQRLFYGSIIKPKPEEVLYKIYIAVIEQKKGYRTKYKDPQLWPVTAISLPLKEKEREGFLRILVESIKKRGFSIVLFI